MKISDFVFGLLLANPLVLAQTNSVPFVNQPLVPSAVAPGGPSFTLTVNGTGFVSGSTVNWNGVALATSFVSSSQLTATVPAGNIANASTASITVSSPTPGGGTSSPIYLGVTDPIAPLIFTNYFEGLYFDGTLVTPFANAAGAGEYTIPVAGDFDNDGKLDLAFIAYAIISTTSPTFQTCIELGNGDGSFQIPNCTAVSPPMAGETESPARLIAADFNGDGKLDLALSNGTDGTNTVSVFLGKGDGTLQAPQSFPAGPSGYSQYPGLLSVGDFNGDGKLDLAVADTAEDGHGYVAILLGNGDGTFQNPIEYYLSVPTQSPTVGDFNGDGKLDLVLSIWAFPEVYLALGNGDGTFQPSQVVANLGGSTPVSTATADVNGDGKLDLVISTDTPNGNGGFAVLLGNGDGTFQPPVTYSTPYFAWGGPVIADINGDGKPDLLLTPWGGVTTLVSALIGNGDGTFQTAINLPTPALPVGGTGQPVGLLAGDFNGDGKVDLLLPYLNSAPPSTLTESFFFFVQGSFTAAGISPTSVTFPQLQAVGSTSSPQSVTLTNLGGTPLTLSGITLAGQNAGDFAETNQCTASLAVGASCQISVTFTPTGFGNRNGILVIANDGLGGTIGVALTGTTPPGVSVSLSPLNVSFPSQYVGTSGLPQTLTVTNTGSATLMITNVASSTADFATLSNCTNSVPPNANCTIGVFFDPTASGTRSGTLTITDNATGSPQTVTLTGTGQDFSMAPTSSASATVSPGQSATYNLTVAPAGGFNQTVTLSCSGAPNLATCSVSPASMALSGTSSSAATVTVTTSASTTGLMQPIGMPPSGGALRSAALLAMFGLMLLTIRTSWRYITGLRLVTCGFVFLMLIALVALPGCGGSSSNSSGGTPPGSYNLTVTGTFSSGSTTLTHATKLTLVVQ